MLYKSTLSPTTLLRAGHVGHRLRFTRPRLRVAAARQAPTVPERSNASIDIEDAILPRDLGKLSELHVGNVYKLGLVKSPDDLAKRLNTNLATGIPADDDIGLRAKVYGVNSTRQQPQATFLDLVIDACKDFTLFILGIAGLTSLGLEFTIGGQQGREANWIESASILAAVGIVVIVTAASNWQKESQFRALRDVQKGQVRAIRGGQEMILDAQNILVGDLLLIEQGDVLHADGVLVDGQEIKCDESHLTGESGDVSKDPFSCQALYSGSKVLSGFGKMLVSAVGRNSQAGAIAEMLIVDGSNKDGLMEETMLQKKLATYASTIGKAGLGAALIATTSMVLRFSIDTFIAGGNQWDWLYLTNYLDFVITGITILVVAVPEGLPLAVTIALAYSVQRMCDDNVLVRHLSAAETAGTATVLCTDKTGTLTQNDMVVTKLWMSGKMYNNIDSLDTELTSEMKDMLSLGIAVNSTANIFTDDCGCLQESGNKTEIALLRLALGLGADVAAIRDKSSIISQVPFSSERKMMSTTVHTICPYQNDGKVVRVCTKGAADILLRMCSWRLTQDGEMISLTDEEKNTMLESFQGNGLRTLCLAYKDVDADKDTSLVESSNDLVLVAVMGLEDPLRPGVPETVQKLQRAGITVKMLTGDNAITAAAIARKCHILPPSTASSNIEHVVMEGQEFRRLVVDPDGTINANFPKIWADLRVLARCTPADKYTIVTGVKTYLPEEVVMMTGDGTNDAPALRLAHVGFAFNSGTDIAKEASDVVLIDDNFASTIFSVLWGRNVYQSVTKFLQFQLTINIVAVAIATGGAMVSAESPLTATQMLWVNLIMDSLASLALATEPPDPSLLTLPPYSTDYNFISNPTVLKSVVGQATYQLSVLIMLLQCLPGWLDIPDGAVVQGATIHYTMVFNTFVMMQLFNQLNCRKVLDASDVHEGLLDARLFLGVVASEAVLQFLIVQFGGGMFSTIALDLDQWLLCLGFGSFSLLVREVLRRIPTTTVVS